MEEGGGGWHEYLPEPGRELFSVAFPTVRRLQRGDLFGSAEGFKAKMEVVPRLHAFLPRREKGVFIS